MTAYSPLLALGTGLFELLAAAWVFRSPGRPQLLRPAGLILLLLAGYQLLEAFLCTQTVSTWPARLAFADVVWLPPLGVWLVLQLAAPVHRRARGLAGGLFVLAGGLTAWILLDPTFVRATVCQAVIATYRTPGTIYSFYGAFYQLGLFGMIILAAWGMVRSDDRLSREHLADVQLGTLGFVLPALLTQVLYPQLIGSMPSVMCHYALILALFLTRLAVRERRVAPVPVRQEQACRAAG